MFKFVKTFVKVGISITTQWPLKTSEFEGSKSSLANHTFNVRFVDMESQNNNQNAIALSMLNTLRNGGQIINENHPLNEPKVEVQDEDDEICPSEFLPVCDFAFNIISLAIYFCDVVFDLVTVYTLYYSEDNFWFLPTSLVVAFSSIISQVLSLRWYARMQPCSKIQKIAWTQPSKVCILITHFLQCGILWRYFRLFVPVNLLTVKHEVGDLCMLRMVHAFCEAAPMILIQVINLSVHNLFSVQNLAFAPPSNHVHTWMCLQHTKCAESAHENHFS